MYRLSNEKILARVKKLKPSHLRSIVEDFVAILFGADSPEDWNTDTLDSLVGVLHDAGLGDV